MANDNKMQINQDNPPTQTAPTACTGGYDPCQGDKRGKLTELPKDKRKGKGSKR